MTTRGGTNSGDPTCGGYGCGTVYHLVVSSVMTISEVDNGFSNVPNSPIQSGSWVVIKGTNLSTNPGRGWNANESFPTSMDGTSVTINYKPAFLYFISPGQLNLQAPTDSTVGPITVVVTNNGVTSEATAHYQSRPANQIDSGQLPIARWRADQRFPLMRSGRPPHDTVSAPRTPKGSNRPHRPASGDWCWSQTAGSGTSDRSRWF